MQGQAACARPFPPYSLGGQILLTPVGLSMGGDGGDEGWGKNWVSYKVGRGHVKILCKDPTYLTKPTYSITITANAD